MRTAFSRRISEENRRAGGVLAAILGPRICSETLITTDDNHMSLNAHFVRWSDELRPVVEVIQGRASLVLPPLRKPCALRRRLAVPLLPQAHRANHPSYKAGSADRHNVRIEYQLPSAD